MAVLAAVGILLVANYVDTAEARALGDQEPREVYLVTAPIPEGTPIEELSDVIELHMLPAVTVPENAITDLTDYQGKVAGVDLQPGEQLLASRLVEPAALEDPGTVPVPKGMREVTFTLGPDRVVGGQLKAGDRVGMIVSREDEDDDSRQRSALEFPGLLITAVQGAPAAPSAEETAEPGAQNSANAAPAVPEGSLLITVAVSAADAEKVVFANEFGSVWLSKETKDSESESDGATAEDFR